MSFYSHINIKKDDVINIMKCDRFLKLIHNSLSEIDNKELGSMPFALMLNKILPHRIYDLGFSAFRLLMEERLIPSALLVRATVETVAVLIVLNIELRKFIKSKDKEYFYKKTKKLMFCTRAFKNYYPEEIPESINILSLIEKADKEVSNYLSVYEQLSEYCHPNTMGLFSCYTTHTGLYNETGLDLTDNNPLLVSAKANRHAMTTTTLALRVSLANCLTKEASNDELLEGIKKDNLFK